MSINSVFAILRLNLLDFNQVFKLIKSAGFNGVLIGEALVTADDPLSFLQDLRAVE